MLSIHNCCYINVQFKLIYNNTTEERFVIKHVLKNTNFDLFSVIIVYFKLSYHGVRDVAVIAL